MSCIAREHENVLICRSCLKPAARLSFANSFQLTPIVIFNAAIEDEGDVGLPQRRRIRTQNHTVPSDPARRMSAPSAPSATGRPRGGRPLGTGRPLSGRPLGTGRPKGGRPARKRVMNTRRKSLPRKMSAGQNMFLSSFSL